jgi:hypothetical protein
MRGKGRGWQCPGQPAVQHQRNDLAIEPCGEIAEAEVTPILISLIAVNANGQIVGLSGDCSFYDPTLRAVISDNGKPFVDLNTLIPADSGVQLRNATFINDRGEIVAVAYFPDGHHAPVLLVPNAHDHD